MWVIGDVGVCGVVEEREERWMMGALVPIYTCSFLRAVLVCELQVHEYTGSGKVLFRGA